MTLSLGMYAHRKHEKLVFSNAMRLRAAFWRQKTQRRRRAALLELGVTATGKQYGRQRPWPLVSRTGQSSLGGAF